MIGVSVDVEQDLVSGLREAIHHCRAAALAHVDRRHEVGRAHPKDSRCAASGPELVEGGDPAGSTGPQDPTAFTLGATAPHPVIDPVREGIL
jgi:hypothetical protein